MRIWRLGWRVAIDATRRAEILKEIDQNAELGHNFLVLVLLSCVIATFGLVQNSAAVIIGAMLIAPLMGPIIAVALALVYGDPLRVVRAMRTLLIGAIVAIALSAVLGRLVSVVGTFDFGTEGLPSEILSRTQPSLFDLAVALAGGTAASYALVQPRLSSALAGVAIATALMPPLCVVGIGLSQGDMTIWGGALLLFLTNFVAIVFAGSGIFALAGFLPTTGVGRRWRLPRARLINLLLLLPVVFLLTTFTINIAQQAQTTAAIRATLVNELHDFRSTSLVSVDRTSDAGTLNIVATIRSPLTLTLSETSHIEEALAVRLQRRVALKLLVVPITSLNPLNPPTLSPTASPTPRMRSSPISTRSATETATPPHPTATRTVVAIKTQTPSPTAVLVSVTRTITPVPLAQESSTPARAVASTPGHAQAVPSRTPTQHPRSKPSPTPSATVPRTSTPLPTQSATSSATYSRTPTPRPTRSSTATATAIAYAVVGGTHGLGVYSRRTAGLTAIVAALPDGTVVQLTGAGATQNGYRWVQAILPDGRVVWIPKEFLVPRRTYIPPQ